MQPNVSCGKKTPWCTCCAPTGCRSTTEEERRAATYALLKQKDKMLETLSRAIANDGEYKDEALNDAAFRNYWNDPAFKDIAEG